MAEYEPFIQKSCDIVSWEQWSVYKSANGHFSKGVTASRDRPIYVSEDVSLKNISV